MYINNNFTLDTAHIGHITTDKRNIKLAYTGPLPDELSDATNATITIMLQVGLTVKIILTTERDGKKHNHPVKAIPKEIDQLLHPFFFTENGMTRWNNGLDRYWLGIYQSSYINWRRLSLRDNSAVVIA